MKRPILIGLLAICLFLSIFLSAQAQTQNIVFIDLQRVMLESDRGKEAKMTLTTEAERLKKQLDVKQDELQKLKDSIEKQSLSITPEARAEKEKQYQNKLRDYQRIYNDYQTELQQKDAEYSQRILRELEEVIKGLGERDKYTIILEKTQAGILFGAPAADITDKVIQSYNESIKKKAQKK